MRCFLYAILAFTLVACSAAPYKPFKVNGVSFVASRQPVDSSHIAPILKINANAASVMPFGFIRDKSHPEILFNTDRQWFGETKDGAKQYIQELHNRGISVMLKPQIWIRRGEFTGNLVMTSEDDWTVLEESYSQFILSFAEVAKETEVDIFCIGTELELFVKHRPAYWNQLIQDIKKIYKGKLTYAANWDEFWRTPFWNDLDYVGIDAYFPVSDKKTPTVEDCIKGWERHKEGLKSFSNTLKKPILFTEYGYRSVDYAGKQPWQSDRSMTSVNHEAQENTTKALFETFWHEEWFAGGYIWKWFINHERSGGLEDNRFTPQNKPVERVIQSYYSTAR